MDYKISIESIKNMEKKNSKLSNIGLGWGWVIVFAINSFVYSFLNNKLRSLPEESILCLIESFIILLIYFFSRDLIIIIIKQIKVSKASLISGIITFLFSICFSCIINIYLIYNHPKNVQLTEIFKNFQIQKLKLELNKLNQIDISSELQIPKALEIIELAQTKLLKLNNGYNELSLFIDKNKQYINDYKALKCIVNIININNELVNRQVLKTAMEYFETFKMMLLFTRNNYKDIVNGKSPEINLYNKYYDNSKEKLQKLRDISLTQANACKNYLEINPDCKVYYQKYILH